MSQSKDKGAKKRTNSKTTQKEKQPSEPNVTLPVLAVLVTVCFGLASFFFNLSHKILAIGIFFIGLTFAFAAISLYVRQVLTFNLFLVPVTICFMICFTLGLLEYHEPTRKPQIAEPSNINSVPTPTPELPKKLADGRIVVDMSPEDFEHIFEDNTDIMARKLVEPYVDKWIFTWGKVENVVNREDGKVFVVLGRTVNEKFTAVVAVFRDDKEIERVRLLKRGDEIKLLGQIELLPKNPGIRLWNCEIID